MRRGTTPTHRFSIPVRASDVANVKILYSQFNKCKVTKCIDDIVIDDYKVTTRLTQEETLRFSCNTEPVSMQVRLLTKSGISCASNVIKDKVYTCLEDDIILPAGNVR